MKSIVGKLQLLLQDLEQTYGDVLVFALFLPDEPLERWDLVVAAPWLDSATDAYKIVAGGVQRALSGREIIQMSRVVIVKSTEPAVSFLQDTYDVPHGSFKDVENCHSLSRRFQFTIKRAYIFRCTRSAPKKRVKTSSLQAMC